MNSTPNRFFPSSKGQKADLLRNVPWDTPQYCNPFTSKFIMKNGRSLKDQILNVLSHGFTKLTQFIISHCRDGVGGDGCHCH
jgi:hypothetical protein